jgi:hypothetical protein
MDSMTGSELLDQIRVQAATNTAILGKAADGRSRFITLFQKQA